MAADNMTPLCCVDCWFDRELVRTASYVYDGLSVCSRHMMVRRAMTVPDTVGE